MILISISISGVCIISVFLCNIRLLFLRLLSSLFSSSFLRLVTGFVFCFLFFLLAHVDTGSPAVLTWSQDLTGGFFTSKNYVRAKVTVSNVEPNEKLVVRTDVRVHCKPGSNPTGNLMGQLDYANIIEAYTAGNVKTTLSPPTAFSSGTQTVPFKLTGMSGLGTAALSVTIKSCVASGCTCGVNDVTELTYSTSTFYTAIKFCMYLSNLAQNQQRKLVPYLMVLLQMIQPMIMFLLP